MGWISGPDLANARVACNYKFNITVGHNFGPSICGRWVVPHTKWKTLKTPIILPYRSLKLKPMWLAVTNLTFFMSIRRDINAIAWQLFYFLIQIRNDGNNSRRRKLPLYFEKEANASHGAHRRPSKEEVLRLFRNSRQTTRHPPKHFQEPLWNVACRAFGDHI